mgnify:FL=1
MDDTAFFYSRTLRIIVTLAIVVPIVVIATLLLYYHRDSAPDTLAPEESPAATIETLETPPPEELTSADENPLRPLGPKASTRMTPGGSVCQYCGGAGCPSCR